MKKEILYNLQQVSEVAQDLAILLKNYSIITLTGDLGAGKTTLVKQLLKQWGVQDVVLSPTFTYVNCYQNDQGKKIFHFDCYRITSLDQFIELGFDEYLSEPGVLCIIEWPQVIRDLLNEQAAGRVCDLEIEHMSDDQRKLTIKK